MKYCLTFLLLFNTYFHAMAQQPIALETLQGKWYIHFTNFPMWTKGDKTSPTFNYSVFEKNGSPRLHDEVQYVQKAKNKSIVGVDTPLDSTNMSFEWRGKGMLSVLTSRWKIVYFDTQNNWALVSFEKTMFTPAGYDIIARERVLDSTTISLIQAVLAQLQIANLSRIEQ